VPPALLAGEKIAELPHETKRPPEERWAFDEALLAKAESLDQLAVAIGVLALEVIKHLAPLAYHPEQTATGMVILDMSLEVTGKLIYT